MDRKLRKSERLSGLKTIEMLFNSGQAFISYPFRIVFLRHSEYEKADPAVRIMVSVSKKRFKKAVDRNRVKRMMREAYRLNKSNLNEYALSEGVQLYVALQYVAKEILPFETIEPKMIVSLDKLAKLDAKTTRTQAQDS